MPLFYLQKSFNERATIRAQALEEQGKVHKENLHYSLSK